MRQWELFGITDNDPDWVPPQRAEAEAEPLDLDRLLREIAGASVFFWTTDAALRIRTVTDAAATLLGRTRQTTEGRDLLDVVGSVGESLPVLEAHVSALYGETSTFTLRGAGQVVRCRVAPTRDASETVIGTFCLAVTREAVDVREGPQEGSRKGPKLEKGRRRVRLEVA